jgi:hypothetical protein
MIFGSILKVLQMKTSTTRFSDRVEDYIKYRPHYSEDVIRILKNEIELNGYSIVADVGSGTGIFNRIVSA